MPHLHTQTELAKRHPLVQALRYQNFGGISAALRPLFSEYETSANDSRGNTAPIVYSVATGQQSLPPASPARPTILSTASNAQFTQFLSELFYQRSFPNFEICEQLCARAASFVAHLSVFNDFDAAFHAAQQSRPALLFFLFKLVYFVFPKPNNIYVAWFVQNKQEFKQRELDMFLTKVNLENCSLAFKMQVAQLDSNTLSALLDSNQVSITELPFSTQLSVFDKLPRKQQLLVLRSIPLTIEISVHLAEICVGDSLIIEFLVFHTLKNGLFLELLEKTADENLQFYRQISEEMSISFQLYLLQQEIDQWKYQTGMLLVFYQLPSGSHSRNTTGQALRNKLSALPPSHLLDFFWLEEYYEFRDPKHINCEFLALCDVPHALAVKIIGYFSPQQIAFLINQTATLALALNVEECQTVLSFIESSDQLAEQFQAFMLVRCRLGLQNVNCELVDALRVLQRLSDNQILLYNEALEWKPESSVIQSLESFLALIHTKHNNFNSLASCIEQISSAAEVLGDNILLCWAEYTYQAIKLSNAIRSNPISIALEDNGISVKTLQVGLPPPVTTLRICQLLAQKQTLEASLRHYYSE